MYKRQIDGINNIKSLEIYGSSKKGAYFSLNSFLENTKPYNGLYIYNKKVMVSNVEERMIFKGNEYLLSTRTTISDEFSNKEYICEIDLDKLEYMYRCENVTYSKKMYWIKNCPLYINKGGLI